MVECSSGKYAAPVRSDTDATKEGGQFVADISPEIEAAEGELPDTVHGTCALWFSEAIIELSL